MDAMEIIVYGDGQHVRDVLNAVAAFSGSGTMGGLLAMAMLCGIVAAGVQMLTRGGFSVFSTWFMTFVMVVGVMIVPKANVVVNDRLNPNLPGGVVQNVPMGVAFLASATSLVGDELASAFETVMNVPQNQMYTQGGLFWGHKTLARLPEVRPTNAVTQENLRTYLANCPITQISTRRLSAKEILESDDLLTMFEDANLPGLMWYNMGEAGREIVSCQDAIGLVETSLNNDLPATLKVSGRLDNPDLDDVDAAQKFLTDVQAAADTYLGLSKDGALLLRQAMVVNEMRPAATSLAASVGNADLMNYVSARTSTQSRTAMGATGRMMGELLPSLFTIMFVVLCAVFPIVAGLSLVPGVGLSVIKNWAIGFASLQMWPILFIIINRFIVVDTAEKAGALAKIGESGNVALTMANIGPISEVPSALAAQAGGMLAIIPVLSFILFKSISSMGHQMENILSPVQSASSQAAADATTGNITTGAVSMNTANMNNMTANQHRSSADVDTGNRTYTTSTGNRITGHRDGSWSTQAGTSISNGALKADVSRLRSTALSSQLVDSQAQTEGFRTALSNSMQSREAQALQVGELLSSGRDIAGMKGTNMSKSWNTKRDAVVREYESIMSGQEARNTDSTSIGNSIEGSASAGVQVFGTGAKTKAAIRSGEEATASLSDTASNQRGNSEEKQMSRGYLDAVSDLMNHSDTQKYSGLATMADNWTKTSEEVETASRNLESSQARTQSLSDMKTEADTVGSNLSHNQIMGVQNKIEELYGQDTAQAAMAAKSGSTMVEANGQMVQASQLWQEGTLGVVADDVRALGIQPTGPSSEWTPPTDHYAGNASRVQNSVAGADREANARFMSAEAEALSVDGTAPQAMLDGVAYGSRMYGHVPAAPGGVDAHEQGIAHTAINESNGTYASEFKAGQLDDRANRAAEATYNTGQTMDYVRKADDIVTLGIANAAPGGTLRGPANRYYQGREQERQENAEERREGKERRGL